ncbi:hypothetical protein FA95DRAFT_656569 [Auriscalpium vulgare]|uniref:Uncharacterized protein n=1 Tax=Auriscalpium vulgare TaxID=40419 RepID=A0ACB8RC70_9AGAM|nr:hypothetical protein FA95DRAFT_656569 [Auriscalpium vulgare]
MSSIVTKSRQLMTPPPFRGHSTHAGAFVGLVSCLRVLTAQCYFVPSVTQTLLSLCIQTCPQGKPHRHVDQFPQSQDCQHPYFPDIGLNNTMSPAIRHNRTLLTYLGCELSLSWDAPGARVGFNGSFKTNPTACICSPWRGSHS